jgi:hypothetical protein
MKQLFFILCVSSISFTIQAQSFIFNQFFRPSVRVNTLYSHDFNFNQKDRLHVGDVNVNCIIPIASKLQLKMDWEKVLKLKLKKAAKLRFYQIFWNFRPRIVYADLGYQSTSSRHPFDNKAHVSYGFSTGLTGIHLLAKPLKKPKFLFYQFNIGLLESIQSIRANPTPNITTLIGVANIKSFNFYWYYGIYFAYNNGQILPAPFFGIQAKLSKRFWVNITLPVQVRFAIKFSPMVKLDIGASLAGFGTPFGYEFNNNIERHILGGLRIKTGAVLNLKLSPQATLYLDVGAYPYQLTTIRGEGIVFDQPQLGIPFYSGLSFYYSFKKALLGSVVDGIIMF